jgi:protein involved in polysaccharide export with SLBB domain
MVGFHPSQSVKSVSRNRNVFPIVAVALLVAATAGLVSVPSLAKVPQTPDPSAVKAQVTKFGVGKAVKVKLVGGQKLSGHIRSIGPDSFTVKVDKSAAEKEIPYDQVLQVKDPGPLTWMLLGAALVIVIIVVAR